MCIRDSTYTVLSQIVSEKTGIPYDKIEVVLGDTALPPGPISGGSWAVSYTHLDVYKRQALAFV